MELQNFEYWTIIMGMVAIFVYLQRVSHTPRQDMRQLSERATKIEDFLLYQSGDSGRSQAGG